MSFIHLLFRGETTTPWHIGRRGYGDYLYTRRDYLWGRGVRGPVLRQLWRAYCPRSDLADGVSFNPDIECQRCPSSEDCPFNNLRGADDEGEYKDKPRLIFTNLRFAEDTVRVSRVALASISDVYKSVAPGRAPVYIEYIEPGAKFTFEVILMGVGVRFTGEIERAVSISLSFFGWGGFCNEGFGRGRIGSVERRSLDMFEESFIKPRAELLEGRSEIHLRIEPVLILDKPTGGIYLNTSEDGFPEKLSHSINERYWQFYGRSVYVPIAKILGRARPTRIMGWSRRYRQRQSFTGIGGEFIVSLDRGLSVEEAEAIATSYYGIGRYKNQGFGSLEPVVKG